MSASIVDSIRVSRYPRDPERDATAILRIDGESRPAAVLYSGAVHGRRKEELREAGYEGLIVVRYEGKCPTRAHLGVDAAGDVYNLRLRDGEILADPVTITPLPEERNE